MAAYTAIVSAVAKTVMEAKLKVVDDLVAFLETKIEVDDELKAIFGSFKDSLKENEEKAVKAVSKKGKGKASDSSDGEKKKRAPSLFNLFVKDKMPELKAQHPEIKDGKQMISLASEAWKSDPLALFLKEKVPELKKEDADSDTEALYKKAKAMFKGVESGAESEGEEKPKKAPTAKKAGGKKAKKVEPEEEASDAGSDVEEKTIEEVIEKPKKGGAKKGKKAAAAEESE